VTQFGSPTLLSGQGTISFVSSATPSIINLLSDFDYAPGAIPALDFGGTNRVTINGPGTFINEGTIRFNGDIMNAAFDNRGTFIAEWSGNQINDGLLTSAGSTIRVEGNGIYGTADLSIATSWSNKGLLEFDESRLDISIVCLSG